MSEDNRAKVKLKKGEGRYLKSGGAWIFDNEIDTVSGTYDNGDIVSVIDFDDYPMGIGYINDNSKIRVRMLSRNPDTVVDEAFFEERVKKAWDYRKTVMGDKDTGSCRVVFGEADF